MHSPVTCSLSKSLHGVKTKNELCDTLNILVKNNLQKV